MTSSWLSRTRALARATATCALVAAASIAGAQDAETRAPTVIEGSAPSLPREAFADRERAEVIVNFSLDAEGRVLDVTLETGAGEPFDAVALEAARAFRFAPAIIAGQPSASRILYRFEFLRPADPRAALAGIVRDDAGAPLADATVRLSSGKQARTDAQGAFAFDTLVPGEVELTIEHPAIATVRTQETLTDGERLEVAYDVPRVRNEPQDSGYSRGDDIEIVVTAPALSRTAVSTSVDAEQARRTTGTQGDVVRVVENLPGVARAQAGAGQLVVWGAAPEETRVYIDGVPVPRLYHEGGLRSTLGSDLIGSVRLLPGGYGAAYGRGLGGVVLVDTQLPDREGIHGRVGADLYDGSFALFGRTDSGTRLGASGRVGWLAPLARAVVGEDASAFVPIGDFWDAQALASFDLGGGQTFAAGAITSGDRFGRGVPNADPALATRERRRLDFHRAWASYARDAGDGAQSRVLVWGGADLIARESNYGAVETSDTRDSLVAGVRLSHRTRIADWLTIEGGLDAELSQSWLTRTGSLALPPREGDPRVFGQPPPDERDADTYRVLQVGLAPYAELDVALFDGAVHVVPGLRIDPQLRQMSRRTPRDDTPARGLLEESFVPEPRVAITAQPIDVLSLQAAYGLYHRSPSPEDLGPVFGTPTLTPSEAHHGVLGAALRATDTLSIELTGFATFSTGLAVRSAASEPRIAQALEPIGEGRSYGVTALVRQQPLEGFFGWVSYTLMRAERRNGSDQEWRLFDYDQTHVLTVLAGWTPGYGFEVGARFRWATGLPRTPVIDRIYDARRDRSTPVFGAINSARLSDFVQLDVRVAQRIEIDRVRLELYLEVLNVTNQENAEEIVYDPTFTQSDVISGLPILPVIGVSGAI